MEETCRAEDDQQSGNHLPGGSSCAMHEQLHGVTDL